MSTFLLNVLHASYFTLPMLMMVLHLKTMETLTLIINLTFDSFLLEAHPHDYAKEVLGGSNIKR